MHSVTLEFKMAAQNQQASSYRPRQVSASNFKVLSYAQETKFGFCDLIDLETQGHHLKINRHSEGPIRKQYAKFQSDSCNIF